MLDKFNESYAKIINESVDDADDAVLAEAKAKLVGKKVGRRSIVISVDIDPSNPDFINKYETICTIKDIKKLKRDTNHPYRIVFSGREEAKECADLQEYISLVESTPKLELSL